MSKNVIITAKFDSRFAVGACAIQFARDLVKTGADVSIVCGSFEGGREKEFKVASLASRLPFSVQTILLSFHSLKWKYARVNVHSFEIPTFSPTTYHIHSDFWDDSKKPDRLSLRSIARFLNRKLIRFSISQAQDSSILIFPSKSLMGRITPRTPSTLKLRVLPNVLLEDDPLNSVSQSQSRTKSKSIGFVAHGDIVFKGLGLVKQYVKSELPDFYISWAGGSGALEKESEVDQVGVLNRTDYSNWLRKQSGVIVASSYESFSMVALEAHSLGIPVLILGEAGIMEFLGPSDFVYGKNDASLFKKALGSKHYEPGSRQASLRIARQGQLELLWKELGI